MADGRRHRSALKREARLGFRGYPIATIAFYGRDGTRATKVAVGIVPAEDAEVSALERWYSENRDVRKDPEISARILAFIGSQGAKSVVMTDRIIGCPHEEGVDYPEGEPCPPVSLLGTPRPLDRQDHRLTGAQSQTGSPR